MRTLTIAVVAAALASPALAADLRQFDLLCSGEKRIDSEDGSIINPASQHLRVDLDRREFCVDGCESTQSIAEITSGSIAFRNTTNIAAPVGMLWSQFFVNRESGKYFDQRIAPNIPSTIEEGVCEVAPFSSFPDRPNNLF